VYAVTWNNPSLSREAFLAAALAWRARTGGREVKLECVSFQLEVGAVERTPHFQTFLWFSRVVSLRQLLGMTPFRDAEGGVVPMFWGDERPHVEEADMPLDAYFYSRKPCAAGTCEHKFCEEEREAPTAQGSPLFASATGKSEEQVKAKLGAAQDARNAQRAANGRAGGNTTVIVGGGGGVTPAVLEWMRLMARQGWRYPEMVQYSAVDSGGTPERFKGRVKPADEQATPPRGELWAAHMKMGRGAEHVIQQVGNVRKQGLDVRVVFVVGDGMVGKTTMVEAGLREMKRNAVTVLSGAGAFMDGVGPATEAVVYDEFSGSKAMLPTLKQVTASTGATVQVKGSTTTCNATLFFFVSNHTPNHWFRGVDGWQPVNGRAGPDYDAFCSRSPVMYVYTRRDVADAPGMATRKKGFRVRG
jgi:hypothetical protein